jgi:hypothetical protein
LDEKGSFSKVELGCSSIKGDGDCIEVIKVVFETLKGLFGD